MFMVAKCSFLFTMTRSIIHQGCVAPLQRQRRSRRRSNFGVRCSYISVRCDPLKLGCRWCVCNALIVNKRTYHWTQKDCGALGRASRGIQSQSRALAARDQLMPWPELSFSCTPYLPFVASPRGTRIHCNTELSLSHIDPNFGQEEAT